MPFCTRTQRIVHKLRNAIRGFSDLLCNNSAITQRVFRNFWIAPKVKRISVRKEEAQTSLNLNDAIYELPDVIEALSFSTIFPRITFGQFSKAPNWRTIIWTLTAWRKMGWPEKLEKFHMRVLWIAINEGYVYRTTLMSNDKIYYQQ